MLKCQNNNLDNIQDIHKNHHFSNTYHLNFFSNFHINQLLNNKDEKKCIHCYLNSSFIYNKQMDIRLNVTVLLRNNYSSKLAHKILNILEKK